MINLLTWLWAQKDRQDLSPEVLSFRFLRTLAQDLGFGIVNNGK